MTRIAWLAIAIPIAVNCLQHTIGVGMGGRKCLFLEQKRHLYLDGTIEALYKGQEMGMLHGIKQGLLIQQVQQYKKRLAQAW